MKKTIENFSLKDSLELAIQIELQAKERYEEFARQIGSITKGDAGDFFSSMALSEAKHAEELINKHASLFGNQKHEIFIEDYYEYLEAEAPAFDRSEVFMTVKAALNVALDSEIKAYQFYKKLSELSFDENVKSFFCELMEEEKLHQKMAEEQLGKITDSDEPLRDNDEIDEPNGL